MKTLRCIVVLVACLAYPQDKVDAVFQQVNRADSPGASVAVIKDGKIVVNKGYGSANLEYDARVTPETIFHVASVSKQFTAMSLVLLEQDGKLSLEDDVHKYLTELPDYGNKITIRNLLQHTSGIRDQWQTLAVAGWRLDDVITQDQILRVLFRQKELNFNPGEEHLYSNGGYTLAAEIVRRVSGQNLRAFTEERIFKPLEMSHTHFHDDLKMIVKNRAVSYSRAGSDFLNAPLNYENMGATSLFTTPEDLARWLDNFRAAKVGGAAGVARMQEQAVLNSGKKIDYALGISVDEYRGLKRIQHSGGDAGYRSMVEWYPEANLGVAVVSNLGSFNTGGAADRVAEAFVEERMKPKPAPKPPAPKPEPISVWPEKLAEYAGNYLVPERGIIEVEIRNGKLLASPTGQPRMELVPIGPDKFFVEAMNLEVSFQASRISFMQGGSEMRGERIAKDAKPPDLTQYAGVYWSDELETQYKAVVEDGKLKLRHIRHGDIDLRLAGADTFNNSTWFMSQVRFTRDAQGKVVSMRAGGGRVRGIVFNRR